MNEFLRRRATAGSTSSIIRVRSGAASFTRCRTSENWRTMAAKPSFEPPVASAIGKPVTALALRGGTVEELELVPEELKLEAG